MSTSNGYKNRTMLSGMLCATILGCAAACPFLQKQQQQQSSAVTAEEATGTSAHRLSAPSDDEQIQRRIQTACGGEFCYGSLTSLPALELEWSTLVSIAAPSSGGAIGYMEDSQDREAQLGGFPLNSAASSGAAGYTYLGQLLSHDMNHDVSSTLGVPIDPATVTNFNSPMVDLDTIYSVNGCTPNLLNETHFILNGRDYERDTGSGAALICDPRNDEHRILSQIAVAFMTLHNKFIDDFGLTFDEARDATIREWQAVVLNDLLPNLLDSNTLADVAGGNRVLYVGDALDSNVMPAEFSAAAYRLFHSRARPNYRLNSNDIPVVLFDVGDNEPNLLGGSPLPDDLVIEWERFFGDPTQAPRTVEAARILDMLYVQPLIGMPFGEAGTPDGSQTAVECDGVDCPIVIDEPIVGGELKANLAVLDLLRGQTHSLPGGIAYAEFVRTFVPSLTVLDIEDMAGNEFGLPADLPDDTVTDVPLLLYLAHESIRDSDGEVLGELGSRIVAETIYGSVETAIPSILDGAGFVSLVSREETVTARDVLDFIEWE